MHAVAPSSMPTGMVTSPGRQYIYAGEGAQIALLVPSDMANPVKTFQLGARGVVPVAMVLDPDADVEGDPGQYVSDPEDLLYVAAGRDGLWIVHADPRANGANPAFRADDSPNGNPSDQSGRRWASALDFVTVGDTEYLAVLFAAKDDSWLRLYELQYLRDLANDTNSTETGSEIAPARNISLNQSLEPHIDYWHSFAFGLAVDQDGGPTEGGADVYVAHGAHGLVRVRLYPNVSSPFPEIDLEIGPWFGDQSAYADPNKTVGSFEHESGFGTQAHPWDHRVYDDLKYIDRSGCPADCAVVELSHPPIFTDVAYHDGFLYATVESAGWVRFELRDSQGTDLWAQDMGIDHHEGWQNRIELDAGSQCQSPCGDPPETDEEILLGLIAVGEAAQHTWTRRIVVSVTTGGPVLAVSAAPERIASVTNFAEQRHEGRTHTDPLSNAASAGMNGESTYTFLYRLGCDGFAPGAQNHRIAVQRGGDHVLVPPDQGESVDFCAQGDPVVFVASSRKRPIQTVSFLGGFEDGPGNPDDKFSTYWVRAPWDGSTPQFRTRTLANRPGYFSRYPAPSLLDWRITFIGNDAGLRLPGVPWTCGTEVRNGLLPAHPLISTDPANLHSGILMNPEAQWLADPGAFEGPPQAYFWRAFHQKWSMFRYSGGETLCDTSWTPPKREKHALIDSPEDRFKSSGRPHYLPGLVWLHYDEWFAQQTGISGAQIVFGCRAGTDWGVVVMRRDILQARLNQTTFTDGDPIDPVGEDALVGTLVTAPEFAGVESAIPPDNNPHTVEFITGNQLSGPTTNLSPRFFELYDGTLDPPLRRMLAVPAGQIAVKSDDPFMVALNFTVPAPYDQYYRHLKVRIFDITDTQHFTTDTGSPLIPAWTIIGPAVGFAADVRVVEFGGKTWMFVADWTGELLLYDVSGLLGETNSALEPGSFVADRFEVSADLTDQFRSDVYGVVVDDVEWEENGQPRRELYVYVGASRVGIEVLRLRPDQQVGSRLEYLGIVQVPGEAEGLAIREDPVTGERQLLVGNTYGGIRILKYRF